MRKMSKEEFLEILFRRKLPIKFAQQNEVL